MNACFEVASTSGIPMSQDRSVVWKVADVPSAEGWMYTSPTCPDALAEAALQFADGLADVGSHAAFLGSGTFGDVYEYEGVAVKRIINPLPDYSQRGLHDLRANIALNIGLGRIGSLVVPDEEQGSTTYAYSAPEMLAAYIPDATCTTRFMVPVVLMELEKGRAPLEGELPPRYARTAHFDAAIGATGLSAGDVWYDDSADNTIVRDSSQGSGSGIVPCSADTVSRLAKLDVLAVRPYYF